jgi:hypothetical protein
MEGIQRVAVLILCGLRGCALPVVQVGNKRCQHSDLDYTELCSHGLPGSTDHHIRLQVRHTLYHHSLREDDKTLYCPLDSDNLVSDCTWHYGSVT